MEYININKYVNKIHLMRHWTKYINNYLQFNQPNQHGKKHDYSKWRFQFHVPSLFECRYNNTCYIWISTYRYYNNKNPSYRESFSVNWLLILLVHLLFAQHSKYSTDCLIKFGNLGAPLLRFTRCLSFTCVKFYRFWYFVFF